MSRRRVLTFLAATAAIALAAVLYGTGQLTVSQPVALRASGDQSNTGINLLALPYDPSPLVDSTDLFNDLSLDAPEFNDVISLSRFLRASDSYNTVTSSRSSGLHWTLQGGEAYLVQVSDTFDYVAEGQHDPGLVIFLDARGTNGSASGFNLYAPPFTTPATMASDLVSEINTAAGVQAVVSISQFQPTTDSWLTYVGRTPANDFQLEPGRGYLVQMAADASFAPAWK